MPWLDHLLPNGLSIDDDDRNGVEAGVRIGVGVDSLMVEDDNGLGLPAISSDMATTIGCRARYGDRDLVRLVRTSPSHPSLP